MVSESLSGSSDVHNSPNYLETKVYMGHVAVCLSISTLIPFRKIIQVGYLILNPHRLRSHFIDSKI